MTEWKKLYRKSQAWILAAGLIWLLASFMWAQAPAPPQAAPIAQQPSPSGGDARPPQAVNEKHAGEDAGATEQQKISPKEADELFRSVDEILKFASKDTEFPIKHDVKRQLATRDQMVAYLENSMREDKDAQRLRRSFAGKLSTRAAREFTFAAHRSDRVASGLEEEPGPLGWRGHVSKRA